MQKIKKFKKLKENFTCEKCGAEVIGNGYTNHCSNCLWSKHVDIQPGDRLNACKGMMEPFKIEGTTGKSYKVLHRCTVCKFEKYNNIAETDNVDAVLAVIAKRATEYQNIRKKFG